VWIWLSLSGIVGFVIGDLFLFQAFVDAGARTAMLVYSSVPPMTAVLGWLVLGERLTPVQLVAMALTVAGIMIVTTARAPEPIGDAIPYPRRIRGVWLAVVGALGQAGGLVLSRYGAPTYDAFGATQIRTLSGIAGFVVLFFIARRWRRVFDALRDRVALRHIGRGAFFGPFLGVSMGLVAAQRAGTGVAATIIATVPVLLIPVAIVYFKERVTPREIAGSVTAVVGVGLLFLA
jgi:drug/metabolite transporter (DMT)-like permease